MNGVMNDTKWDELRLAMYSLGDQSPRFRIKDIGHEPSSWDGEWFYHFREVPYREIQWVELHVDCDEQRDRVRNQLRHIHVPGMETDEGFRVFGWIDSGVTISYI